MQSFIVVTSEVYVCLKEKLTMLYTVRVRHKLNHGIDDKDMHHSTLTAYEFSIC